MSVSNRTCTVGLCHVAPRENHRPVASHWQTLSHNDVLSAPHNKWDSNSQQVVIVTDCIEL
jgi:hypothetical protein